MRTTWGIQAESIENASGSSAALDERRGRGRATAGVTATTTAVPAAAEPEMEPALLVGQDADREVEVTGDLVEALAEEVAPLRADEAELRGEGGRGVPCRLADELDQRVAAVVAGRAGREDGLEIGDGVVVAGLLGERPVVDQLVQPADGRVLVRDPGQDQLLEPKGRRLRLVARSRELGGECVQEVLGVAPEAGLEVGQGRGHRSGLDLGLVALDDEMADLVEETERPDLARVDRRRARGPRPVHPLGEAADPGGVAHDEVAADADQRAADGIPVARLAADMEGTIHGMKDGTVAPRDRGRCVRCRFRSSLTHLRCARFGPRLRLRLTRARGARHAAMVVASGGDHHVFDCAPQELEPGRVEVVGPRADPLRPRELAIEPGVQRLARHEDDVGGGVDEVEVVGLLDQGRPRSRRRSSRTA